MSKFTQKEIKAIVTKLEQNKEFHKYPRSQWTKKGSKPSKPYNEVDLIAAIKAGADVGWIDIAPAGLPKSCFKSLVTGLGGNYNPFVGEHISVCDRHYFTQKHLEAESTSLALITFDDAVIQIASSKDKTVQKWMESDEGQVFCQKIEAFLTKEEQPKAKQAKAEPKQNKMDMSWLKK